MKRLCVAALGLAVFAGCDSQSLSPAAPVLASPGVSGNARAELPPLAPSVVDAPISYALAPALTALEQLVPRQFGDLEKRVVLPSNERQSVAFAATRSPFTVAFDGTRLTLTTIVSYQGRGWYNPLIGPTVSGSCGIGAERPRVKVVLSSDVSINPNWVLQSKTRVRSITPLTDTDRDACRVTIFKIDVTDRVVGSFRPLLAKRLPAVDRKVASFDAHRRMEKWYNLLNKSIRVHDSLWLVLAPQQVRLGELRLEDTALIADVRLYARPLLVAGPRPASITTTLPPLLPVANEVGDSAHIRLEGLLGYGIASSIIAEQIVGRRFTRFGRRVTIQSARLYPLGDGRVALALGMGGAVHGDAYFVGTPQIDTITRMLRVPDLDFDVETANALVRGLAWLKKGDLVAELRQRAQVPLEPIVEETRRRVEEALNRDLTDGVQLSGEVQTGRLLDVFADARWLVVRAEATGSIGLGIDRAIRIRRAPRK